MLCEPQLSDMATQEILNQKARCYMFWIIAGTMIADTSGSYLKLMYLPMLDEVNVIGSYSLGSATLAYLYHFLCKASQSIQNEIAGFLPLLQVWAWERITVLRPQIVGRRGTGDIFPIDLRRGPHDTRLFAHCSWTNTTKHVLKVYRYVLDSLTEDRADCFIWQPYTDDLIESLLDYCRAGRHIKRVRVPIFCWDVVEVHLPDRVMRQVGLQQVIPTPFLFDSTHFRYDCRGSPNTNWELEHAQWLPFWNEREQYICNALVNHGPLRYDDPYLIWFRCITHLLIGNPNPCPQCKQGYVPNSTVYETMAHHIHSMVNKAKSLGDMPSYEDLYMFNKIVRDQSSDCLRYVHEADRIHVSADYRRDEVQPDQLMLVEMNEMDEAMQNAQISSEDDQATNNHDFGSTSMGCTQEFTQASGMTYQHTKIVLYMTPQTPQISRMSLNFTLSPVPMSIDNPDATNNLENLNTEMEDNELDDANNEVNGNDLEDESKCCDMTIQHDDYQRKRSIQLLLSSVGMGVTMLTSTPKKKSKTKKRQNKKRQRS
ncbi:hypothetical protein P3S67_021731 [Capsicum chacoense]